MPAVADVLIDAALILGGDTTLKILYMKLLEVCALDEQARYFVLSSNRERALVNIELILDRDKSRSTMTRFRLSPPNTYIMYIIWSFNIFDVCEIFTQANAQTGNDFQDWSPAEAILFCIWAISNYVSVVEAEVMPQV